MMFIHLGQSINRNKGLTGQSQDLPSPCPLEGGPEVSRDGGALLLRPKKDLSLEQGSWELCVSQEGEGRKVGNVSRLHN